MTLTVNGYSIFLIILICFLSTCAFIPLSIKISKYVGALDKPNKRKIHKKPIPTLGGLAIFFGFLLGYMFFAQQSTLMLSILIASFIIVVTGLIDDMKPMKAKYKFLIQIIVGLIIVLYGHLQINEITALGLNLKFGPILGNFITVFFIVAIINAINLIDGMDGLAASISSIYFITVAIIAIILNKFGGLDIMLSIIMIGATLGFLIFNFPPAKLFMGDTGSTFLGLMIAVIALLGFKNVTITSLVIPLLILAIPILDTAFAIVRRKLKGESIGHADKEHLHHQLLKLTSSPVKTLLIICFINILFSAASIFYALDYTSEMIVVYIFLLFILLFLVLKTNIIFDKNFLNKNKLKKKNKNAK